MEFIMGECVFHVIYNMECIIYFVLLIVRICLLEKCVVNVLYLLCDV